MAPFLPVRSVNRTAAIRIDKQHVTPFATTYVDLGNPAIFKELASHFSIGQLVVVGPISETEEVVTPVEFTPAYGENIIELNSMVISLPEENVWYESPEALWKADQIHAMTVTGPHIIADVNMGGVYTVFSFSTRIPIYDREEVIEIGVFKNGEELKQHKAKFEPKEYIVNYTLSGIDTAKAGDKFGIHIRCTNAAEAELIIETGNFSIFAI